MIKSLLVAIGLVALAAAPAVLAADQTVAQLTCTTNRMMVIGSDKYATSPDARLLIDISPTPSRSREWRYLDTIIPAGFVVADIRFDYRFNRSAAEQADLIVFLRPTNCK